MGERISPLGDIYRINLRPAIEVGISPEKLWDAVVESSRMFNENLPVRKRKIEAQIETIGLEFQDIPREPSGHSEQYKELAAPSYRLIHGSLFRDLIRG
ncbi:hypothetical protein GF359_08135 [candidate division WOR-3 bacterium]|uniref:Uncharacterized protein n=1 Tax=candidate division WOR-3 bacterium TaxID=2052148 RepID=A0A9D5KAI0_UNCW3|nr:hypothetical protein [candidate division WOR-3 bacterium]MBD3365169.1 hypothetical protein [candidate division WOR-3 bacterium]